MSRGSMVIWGLFAIGCICVLAHSYATREPVAEAAAVPVEAPVAVRSTEEAATTPNEVKLAQPSSERTEAQAAPASPDRVFQLSSDVFSKDPATRSTAITALATAPPMQAISVLQEVLNSGEPRVDRPLALASLREMALNRGDADGRIRGVLRYAIQNGDQTFVPDAQAVLNEIENHVRQGNAVPAH